MFVARGVSDVQEDLREKANDTCFTESRTHTHSHVGTHRVLGQRDKRTQAPPQPLPVDHVLVDDDVQKQGLQTESTLAAQPSPSQWESLWETCLRAQEQSSGGTLRKTSRQDILEWGSY